MKIKLIILTTILFGMSQIVLGAWIPINASSFSKLPPSIDVQSLSSNSWRINVDVPGIENEPFIDGIQTLSKLSLPDESSLGNEGEAELPVIARLIALRNEGNPQLEIISEDWAEIEGTFDLTRNTGAQNTYSPSTEYETTDSYLPETTAILSPRQIMGGVSLASVQIQAAKYNPVQRRLRVLRSIEVRLHETGLPLAYDRPITETTASILRAIVPNWSEMGLDELIVRGTYLYILASNSIQTNIQPMINWKKRKGHSIEIAGPTQITTFTADGIRNYIQTRYNAANPPLEYVCLVGDANGSFIIPTFAATYDYYSGVSDFNYTRLDGSDIMPDIALGRICFGTTTELLLIQQKILDYERDPVEPLFDTNPNWYKSGGLVVGSGSGISPVHVMNTVRDRMLEAGYVSSQIDTAYYTHESVDDDRINTSLNLGSSVWCYRGYYNLETYSSSDLANLHNDRRIPFMIDLTCATNDFDYDDETELFVRVASKGSIAGIGMSTTGTHTRYNNCLLTGATQGLLTEGINTTGACLNRARIELYRNFPSDSEHVAFFMGITNLIGDPAVDVFTDTPDTLYVNNPATVSLGANTLTLSVTNQHGTPVANAYVNVVKGTEVFTGNRTNASGQVTLNFSTTTADTLFVTASKHNCRPAIDTTLVTTSTRNVTPPSSVFAIDDDNSGSSHGNSDGLVNPAEGIELRVSLKNWGTTIANSVTATLSLTDPYISGITVNSTTYGNIAAGSTVAPAAAFVFTTANYVPDGYILQFSLTATDNASNTWISSVPIKVANGNLEYSSSALAGVTDGILDPSETGQLTLTLTNAGTKAITAGSIGYLRCNHSGVTITDSIGTFTAASISGTCNNTSDTYTISANSGAFPGERIPLTLIIPLASGFADTISFGLTIGSVASNAPTPKDQYGYWAFDNTDVNYNKYPTYNWVEIDPRYGGSGTSVTLTDASDEADATAVVDLPFTFKYYGQNYSQIAVCTNGWLAMGANQSIHTDFRNYSIPSTIGPTGMIAPFWDDLRTVSPDFLLQKAPENKPEDVVQRAPREGTHLDQGADDCANAVVISSLPYNDTGNTCSSNNSCGNTAGDVFYTYTVPAEGEVLQIDLCGSDYDSYLHVYSDCCVTQIDFDDDDCGSLNSKIRATFSAGQIWIMVEGFSSNCGNYNLTVTHIETPVLGIIYTYNDAANHRYIIEWSHMTKYNGGTNPSETFQCILKQPGYPATPTGDGEILFQYSKCSNATDVSSSNNFATIGIENLSKTDGVLYSYYDMISPSIPGAAAIDSGRAVLFTTQKFTPANPKTPTKLVVARSGNDIRLNWDAVTQDINNSPISVSGYNIYRSSATNFTPGPTNLIGSSTTTTYLDVNAVSASTNFYVVIAYLNTSLTGEDNQTNHLSR